ncbi:MAG: hypothetical protein EB089_08910 [Acidimicrobiia bacterium]|nr:hypothetical protein [Acidimicrobiia bacterium]
MDKCFDEKLRDNIRNIIRFDCQDSIWRQNFCNPFDEIVQVINIGNNKIGNNYLGTTMLGNYFFRDTRGKKLGYRRNTKFFC